MVQSPAASLPDAFTSFRVPATNRSERVERGKDLRAKTPHTDLALCTTSVERPDPVDMIEASHAGRLDWLIGVRVARMMASPFGFLRGAANVMAWDVAHMPSTQVTTTICGDAHIGNIGFYRSPEGAQVIDVNDFDEAHTGYWEWDLRRLVASIWVLGRDNGNSEEKCAEAVHDCVAAYRDEVSFLSKQPLLWRAFNRLEVDELHATATEDSLRREIKRQVKAARRRTSDRTLPKYTSGDDEMQIIEDPPLLTRPSKAEYEALAEGLDAYLPTLSPQWRRIVGGYSLDRKSVV